MSKRGMMVMSLVLMLVPLGAQAQDWREVTSFRQRSAESRLDVHVRYGAGELLIRPGGADELYRVALRYDSDVFEPVNRYDGGSLEVGVEGRGKGIRLGKTKSGEMRLQLSPEIPLDLNLDFGAVEADLDLGGLKVTNLDVETGASDTEIRFSEANPVECDRLEISMGAAAFTARGLANANCSDMKVEGGVGELTLEFDGVWARDIDADVTMALGSATLVIPENVGVRVDRDTFLTEFNQSRLSKQGDTYYSDNWDSAERRLNLKLEGAFGSVTIRWSEAATILTP